MLLGIQNQSARSHRKNKHLHREENENTRIYIGTIPGKPQEKRDESRKKANKKPSEQH